jgi:hypothetical protein
MGLHGLLQCQLYLFYRLLLDVLSGRCPRGLVTNIMYSFPVSLTLTTCPTRSSIPGITTVVPDYMFKLNTVLLRNIADRRPTDATTIARDETFVPGILDLRIPGGEHTPGFIIFGVSRTNTVYCRFELKLRTVIVSDHSRRHHYL